MPLETGPLSSGPILQFAWAFPAWASLVFKSQAISLQPLEGQLSKPLSGVSLAHVEPGPGLISPLLAPDLFLSFLDLDKGHLNETLTPSVEGSVRRE